MVVAHLPPPQNTHYTPDIPRGSARSPLLENTFFTLEELLSPRCSVYQIGERGYQDGQKGAYRFVRQRCKNASSDQRLERMATMSLRKGHRGPPERRIQRNSPRRMP